MEEFVRVRIRRGRVAHLVTLGADSPTETLCGRPVTASIVSVDERVCKRCDSEKSRRAQAKR